MMNTVEPIVDKNLERALTRVYVALELTRDVAQRGLGTDLTGDASRSLLTLISVASEMLEEVLDPRPRSGVDLMTDPSELEMLM